MKSIAIIVSVLCLTCMSFVGSAKKPLLSGGWVPVKQEMGGKELPSVAFKGQTLGIDDSNYTVKAESIDRGVVRYKRKKMDIYGKDGPNADKHFTAIYKLKNDTLTVCYNLAGNAYPKKFSTEYHPLYFMAVYIRMGQWQQMSALPGNG